MGPIERIDQAFLSLEFAIKMMNFIELRKIDKDEFDTETTIRLADGNLNFGHSTFHTYDDLILGAQNGYSTALGLSVIAMDTALHEVGAGRDPTDRSIRGQIRSVIYMARCAFAHDLQKPTWRARSPFLNQFLLQCGERRHEVDMAQLNGQPFALEDIGGPSMYFHEIRTFVSNWVSHV